MTVKRKADSKRELSAFWYTYRDYDKLGDYTGELVDGAPKPLKEGASKEECEKIAAAFKEVGATVEIK